MREVSRRFQATLVLACTLLMFAPASLAQNTASVSPTSLDFGSQPLGGFPKTFAVDVFSGLQPMQVSSVAITGNFSQTNDCTNTFTVSACSVGIAFSPQSPGLNMGALTITSSQGILKVPLTGEGETGVASMSSSLVFATQTVDTSSPAQTLTLTNAGGADLQINSFTVPPDFPVQTTSCAGTLAPGAACTFSISFAPVATGDRSALLQVNTNVGTASATLTGTGTPAIATLNPQAIPFGVQAIGSLSPAQPVLVTNISGAPLQLTSLSASSNFLAVSNCPQSLDPGQSCTINAFFAPQTFGPYSGLLRVGTALGEVTALLSASDGSRILRVPADFPTINGAIAAAQDGDTILVSPGTYFEQVNFQSKGITLASVGGAAATILDGQESFGPVVIMPQNQTSQAALRGFTITHGNGSGIQIFNAVSVIEDSVIIGNSECNGNGGAGINVSSSTVLVRGSTIINNNGTCDLTSGGGGVLIAGIGPFGESSQLLNNVISGNQGPGGGGAGVAILSGGNVLIQGNTIQNNSTPGNGGGILIDNFSSADLVQNLVTDNSAAVGGGIYDNGSTRSVLNNTVANNSSAAPTGMFVGGFPGNFLFLNNLLIDYTGAGAVSCNPPGATPPTFFNNDVASLAPNGIAYLGCPDATGTNGNIQQDPQFADVAGGNYHLQPASPAIDSGSTQLESLLQSAPLPDQDLDGNGRIAPGNATTCLPDADMGALEFGLISSGTTLLPPNINFGSTPVGSNSSQAVGIPVQGCLQLASVKVTGEFQESNNCGGAIGNFSNCSVQVTFAPLQTGTRTGTLALDFGSSAPAQSIQLVGTAFLASLPVSPASVGFGDQSVGTTSPSATITIFGIDAPQSVLANGVWISGDFAQTNNCAFPNSAGAECIVHVTFTPTQSGPRSGALVVNTNQGVATISFSGNGVAASAFTFSPLSLAFGDQLVNTTSAGQAVTLTNKGTAALSVLPSISGDFSADLSGCPSSLASGQSCSIRFFFLPRAAGLRSGSFNISKATGPTLALSGTGVTPLAQLAPSALQFGTELLSSTSPAQTITLTAGINALQINSITASGDFTETSTCGATLAPGASCAIQIAFAPSAEGARAGTLTVNSSDGALQSALSGNGLARSPNTIYVPLDQPAIQAGIDAAVSGETVAVLPGTYFEHIDFHGKAITVSSTDGAALTTIDGGSTGTDVSFQTGEGAGSVLSGFTITHGTSNFDGGGVFISSASPTIQENTITANQGCEGIGIAIRDGSPVINHNVISSNIQTTCSGGNGGGISVTGGAPQILNNTIIGNQIPNGGSGGGIALNVSSANISNNVIQHNSVFNDGGGISITNAGSQTIVQNLITDNVATGNGGGIYWLVPSGSRGPFVVNNTVVNNSAAAGSGAFSDGFAGQVQIFNNLFIGSSSAAVVDCGSVFSTAPPAFAANDAFNAAGAGFATNCGVQPGAGTNLSADPQFVDVANANYRLQPASPVIDAGQNSAPNLPVVDLDGAPRVAFGSASTCRNTVDLGVYELALTAAPAATLTPASLDFGNQLVNTSSGPQSFTFTATQGCVTAPAITATGDFAESNTCSSMLGTGASCSIQVTFTPTGTGARSGSLGVISNPISLTAALSGTGAAPAPEFSPAALNFGAQRVNTASTQAINLSNTGNAALPINSLGLSGSAEFTQANNCPVSLAPGTSCTISITFLPISRGSKAASITLNSTQTFSASAALSGTGVAPVATLTPSLTFAAQNAGTSSAQAATLTNMGDAALNISSVSATGDFGAASSCGASLPPAGSCSIQVTFTPSAAGARSGSLTVMDDDPVQGQQTASLSGIGLDYSISATPSNVSVRAGQTASYSVTVTPLGGNFSSAVALGCSGLPAGAKCSFAPASVVPGTGAASSALSITTGSGQHGTAKTPRGTFTVTISGAAGQLTHSTTVTLVVQ